MFGIELKSPRGNQYISGKTYPLLYWGYMDVSFTSDSIGVFDYKYVRLFNLPTSAEVTFAVRTLSVETTPSGTVGAYLWPIKRDDGWYAAIAGDNPTFTARLYVFVHAKDIRKPKYGVEVMGGNGQIIFHSGRPPMAFREMCYSEMESAFSQRSIAVNYKPATLVWSPKVQPYGNGYYRYYNSAHSVGNGQYGIGMTRLFKRAASYTYQLVKRYYYPILDAGHYEQFPNLGNYPQ